MESNGTPLKSSKDRIIKLLISIAFFTIDRSLLTVVKLLGRKPKGTHIILYYHSIPDDQKQAFAYQMDLVQSLSVSIPIENNLNLSDGIHHSSITFDDGFEDNIRNVLPELIKRKIPATIFVTAGRLGQFAEWWPMMTPEREKRIISVENLKHLPLDLITIGSHTLTHPYLSSLNENEARIELCQSRLLIEEILRRPVNSFSFPYGDYNTNLIGLCIEAGYNKIFTSLPEYAFHNSHLISGRIAVDPTDSPIEFRLKLLGAYRWMPFAISLKRKLRSAARYFVKKERPRE